jgi:hypothetical protein
MVRKVKFLNIKIKWFSPKKKKQVRGREVVRLWGWFLIFITTILKGKKEKKTWLLQDKTLLTSWKQ